MNKKTKDLVLAALLTAISILITYSPLRLQTPFFTLTLGAHVPTLIAMFINPWVVIMTVIGSCLGFFMVIPAPNSVIVVVRAATHIIFALAGYKMIKNKTVHPLIILLVTALLHSSTEGIGVYILTPIILGNQTAAIITAATAFIGTFIHHFLDSAICLPILYALAKAKIIHLPQKFLY